MPWLAEGLLVLAAILGFFLIVIAVHVVVVGGIVDFLERRNH